MRETKKIVLPQSKIEVEIYTYLSQRGYEAVKSPFIREKKIKFVEGKGIISQEDQDIAISSMMEANKANIKYMLASFDGKTGSPDDLHEMSLDLCKKDYEFIVNEINAITKEDEETEDLKKKSQE